MVWIKVKPVQCGTVYGCFSCGTSIYICTSKKHLVSKVLESDFPIGCRDSIHSQQSFQSIKSPKEAQNHI